MNEAPTHRLEKPRGRTWKALLVVGFPFGLLVLLGAVALWLNRGEASPVVAFQDGTVIEWLGITRGTNPVVVGKPLEKLLGKLIPPSGFRFRSINLQRPQTFRGTGTDAPLTAWILVRDYPRGTSFQNIQVGLKAIVANSSGRQFENAPESRDNPPFISIPLYAFPRDERSLTLRVSLGSLWDSPQKRQWAEFPFTNPGAAAPADSSPWHPTPWPVTNTVGSFDFILREVSLDPASTSFHGGYPCQFTFRTPSEDWHLVDCRITDEEGNTYPHTGSGNTAGLPLVRAIFSRHLETNRSWKISVRFAAGTRRHPGTTKLPAPEQIHFKIAKQGATPAFTAATFFTSSTGLIFSSQFWSDILSVGHTNLKERTYFFLQSATNELGESVRFRSQSAHLTGTRTLSQFWHIENPAFEGSNRVPTTLSNLTVHLLIPPAIETEFYIRPADRR